MTGCIISTTSDSYTWIRIISGARSDIEEMILRYLESPTRMRNRVLVEFAIFEE